LIYLLPKLPYGIVISKPNFSPTPKQKQKLKILLIARHEVVDKEYQQGGKLFGKGLLCYPARACRRGCRQGRRKTVAYHIGLLLG